MSHYTFAEMGRALAHAWGKQGADPQTAVSGLSNDGQIVSLLAPPPPPPRGGGRPWGESNLKIALRVAGRKSREDWRARWRAAQDASLREWESISQDRAPVPAILMQRIDAHMRAHAYQFASADGTYTEPSCFSERTFGLYCITGRWWRTETATHRAYVAWQKDTKRLRDKKRREASREKTQ